MLDMFLSIVQVVLVPIALGFLINYFFEKVARRSAPAELLPLVSVVGISLIIMAVVAANQAKLLTVGPLIIVVVVLHNVLGYALGYLTGRALSDRACRKTIGLSADAHAVHRGGHAELRPGHLARHGALRQHAATMST